MHGAPPRAPRWRTCTELATSGLSRERLGTEQRTIGRRRGSNCSSSLPVHLPWSHVHVPVQGGRALPPPHALLYGGAAVVSRHVIRRPQHPLPPCSSYSLQFHIQS